MSFSFDDFRATVVHAVASRFDPVRQWMGIVECQSNVVAGYFLTKGRLGSSTKRPLQYLGFISDCSIASMTPVHIAPQQVIEAMRSRRWGGEPK